MPDGWGGPNILVLSPAQYAILIAPRMALMPDGVVINKPLAVSSSVVTLADKDGAVAKLAAPRLRQVAVEPCAPRNRAERRRWAATHRAQA